MQALPVFIVGKLKLADDLVELGMIHQIFAQGFGKGAVLEQYAPNHLVEAQQALGFKIDPDLIVVGEYFANEIPLAINLGLYLALGLLRQLLVFLNPWI